MEKNMNNQDVYTDGSNDSRSQNKGSQSKNSKGKSGKSGSHAPDQE